MFFLHLVLGFTWITLGNKTQDFVSFQFLAVSAFPKVYLLVVYTLGSCGTKAADLLSLKFWVRCPTLEICLEDGTANG